MSEFLDTPELQDKVIVRLVDDDKDFLRSMKLLLEMMGWKVRDFSLAQDFLQEENFKVPGCIVLDMRMPGMTGLELQRQLINDKEKALPIIFLTGHGDVESAVHTLKRGAFDFLQKPVNPLKFNKTVAGYGLGTTFPVPRNRLRFFKFGLPGQPLISRDRLALQFSRFFSLFPC